MNIIDRSDFSDKVITFNSKIYNRTYFNHTLQERDDIVKTWYIGYKFNNPLIIINQIDWLNEISNRWCLAVISKFSVREFKTYVIYFEDENDAIRYKLTWL